MGLLDQKERIFDVQLTDRGRELLSKNQLNFVYYAFSDEGIDYKAAIAASASTGITIDDYVRRNLTFESDSRTQIAEPKGEDPSSTLRKFIQPVSGTLTSRTYYRDLSSFLYTIPNNEYSLPEMKTNKDLNQSVELKRVYIKNANNSYADYVRQSRNSGRKLIVRYSFDSAGKEERTKSYVNAQRNRQNNIYGDIKDVEILKTKDPAEVISIQTKLNNTLQENKKGYLVEVFLSESSGELVKLYKEDTINFENGERKSEGFSSYINIEVDK